MRKDKRYDVKFLKGPITLGSGILLHLESSGEKHRQARREATRSASLSDDNSRFPSFDRIEASDSKSQALEGANLDQLIQRRAYF
jgi:hypothetical protein